MVTKQQTTAKQTIRIKMKAFDYRLIDKCAKIIIDTAERTGAIVTGPIPLPVKKSLYTVNRSTFVHKDAREQFEMRVHKRLIDIHDPNPKTLDALMNLDLPAGVDLEIKT